MTQMTARPDWERLFQQMLDEPGSLPGYYRMFHRYSLGNQALAVMQLRARGIPVGPIASFHGWHKLGRKVRKGEKAISLWMPVVTRKTAVLDDGSEEVQTRKFFVMKNNWFSLAQTEPVDPEREAGDPFADLPQWNKERALASLGIREVPFASVDGNIQGYARPGAHEVAINPLAREPWSVLFHEIAHCLLHADRGMNVLADGLALPVDLIEAEAEGVAYLCCASLDLGGLESCRGYVQHWLASPDRRELFRTSKCPQRVFAAADRILKAGTASAAGKEESAETD